jgi:hypothetical protein
VAISSCWLNHDAAFKRRDCCARCLTTKVIDQFAAASLLALSDTMAPSVPLRGAGPARYIPNGHADQTHGRAPVER